MGDFSLTLVCRNGFGMDVTTELTGMPIRLPEDERVEMTDWDKFNSFWETVYAAQLRRIERNEDKYQL